MNPNDYHMGLSYGGRAIVGKLKQSKCGWVFDSRTSREIDKEEVLRTAAYLMAKEGMSIDVYEGGKKYRINVTELKV